jgi:tripeptide aminopeptidase
MDLISRFLGYVKVNTQSCETTEVTPSTSGQMTFARQLKDELTQLGLQDIYLDEHAYLYATLPANTDKMVPVIGFISHMDTSPDMCGEGVNPRIVQKYDGKDIVLNKEKNIVLKTEIYPEILNHKGEDIIVTDGTTLLGADDKAGIAEIITAVEYLKAHPEIKHGKIRIAFNPDEEIGLGAHKFDVERFGCDFGYTMDGGEVGELEYENFNAASAKFVFHGVNVHPGSAKHKMINANRQALTFAQMLPRWETPEHTEGYEGFYHLIAMNGTVEEATLQYIVRDHDRDRFESRKEELEHLVRLMNERNPGLITYEIKDQYYNMLEKIKPCMQIIDLAKQAMLEAGVTPKVQPIRGGTDGAQLSFKGLPCPNIFAGGMNMHGRYEYVPIPSMEKAMKTIVNICRLAAEQA